MRRGVSRWRETKEKTPIIVEDTIHIKGLQASVRIGVTEAERSRWQTLEVDAEVVPSGGFTGQDDQLEKTVNYAQLSLDLRDVAAARPRQLLETLIEELADHVLANYPVVEVRLALRKFIVPGTQWVGVSIVRQRTAET